MLMYAEWGTLGILIMCSILVLGVVLERWFALRKETRRQKQFQDTIKPFLQDGNEDGLITACAKSDAPLATVLDAVYETKTKLKPDQSKMLLGQALEGISIRLRRFLTVLATMASTAPFIGLFGTVLGIIHTFTSIANEGFSGPDVVSAGISSALIATAFGLGVAIPATIFYNLYLRKVNATMKTVQDKAIQVLIMMGRI